jgi:Domain of unknown function (DUF4382)
MRVRGPDPGTEGCGVHHNRTLAVATGTLLILGLVCGTIVVGCGGGNGGGDTGRLRVSITDQAGAYESVVISISEIRVVPAGDENAPTGPGLPVIATFDPPEVVDVLTLAFQADRLGEAVVPAGDYNQVRLVLAANEGAVLNPILLDFNPEKAIVQTGNGKYLLKPTGVRIVQLSDPLTVYGAFSGTLMPEGAWSTGLVEIVPEAGGDPAASVQVDPTDGSFRAFVPGGTYIIRASADGFDTYTSAAQPVAVGEEIDLGEILLTEPPTP